MGSALGWDNRAAMTDGAEPEETEAVGKRRRRVGAATERGGAEERMGGLEGCGEGTKAAVEGEPGDREDMGGRCLRGGEGLRERSGMRWCGREEEREGGDGGRNGGDGRGARGGMVGRAAGGVLREEGGVEGSRAGCEGGGQGGREGVQVAASVEGVDVGHHGGGPVDCGPVVHEEFLGPATGLVAGSLIGGNGLDGIAVADPVEVAAPDVGVDDGETPSAGCNFADERVVVGFGGGAPAGSHEDGLQAGGGEGFVEGNGGRVGSREEGDGVGGSSEVFRLHEDEGHAGLGPVGFEEGGERAIITRRSGSDRREALREWKVSRRSGVQDGRGMGLRWYVWTRARRGPTRVSKWAMKRE
eukprot:scaffold672_cov109-Amphora_coffeaeformis.AAC.1